MNKMFVIIGSGLLTIVFGVVLVLVNWVTQSTEITPTNVLPLPDLTVTSANVSMVDNNGLCLPYYGLNVTVVNQGDAPAFDVVLADNTGQQVGIGNLNPLQSMSISFTAPAMGGAYAVIADPQNVIVESDENNNIATFSQATATPVASCMSLQIGDTSTPVPTPISPQVGSPATPKVMPGAGTRTLSLDVLQNSTYRSPDWGEFQLSGGLYYRTPPTLQESPETYTTRMSDTVIYGDINLDGFEDAVVLLSTQNGGTGHFVEVAAVLNFNGIPINISTLYLGDRVILESGTIDKRGWITLKLRVHGPNDAACCPSQLAIRTFQINGNQLIERTSFPTIPPLQTSNLYGIPYDSLEWLIIPRWQDNNQTPFNILVLGVDMNCRLTVNTKTNFNGLSEQRSDLVLGSHSWTILKTYQGDQQVDEIYYPDVYPQEYREGGGSDGNGYAATGFYESCQLSIQKILSNLP